MDLTNKLREAIDNLQITWSNKRDEVPLPNHDQVCAMVQETIATEEAALRGAVRFVVRVQHPGQGSRQVNSWPTPHPNSNSGTSSDKPDRLQHPKTAKANFYVEVLLFVDLNPIVWWKNKLKIKVRSFFVLFFLFLNNSFMCTIILQKQCDIHFY